MRICRNIQDYGEELKVMIRLWLGTSAWLWNSHCDWEAGHGNHGWRQGRAVPFPLYARTWHTFVTGAEFACMNMQAGETFTLIEEKYEKTDSNPGMSWLLIIIFWAPILCNYCWNLGKQSSKRNEKRKNISESSWEP